MKICVIEYGAGNWRSVVNACRELGWDAEVTADPRDLARAEKIIFPGVGSFGAAVESLKERGLWDAIRDAVRSDRPFLGICLGLQLLFERSDESPGVEGLACLEGVCSRIAGAKSPQLGWNEIAFVEDEPLFRGVKQKARVYFANSYAVPASGAGHEIAVTQYGGPMTAAARAGNVCGVQFHPEKSGTVGLAILKNFLEA